MDDAARDQLAGLGRVRGHVRRGAVSAKCVHAFPFFDDEERVRSPLRLDGKRAVSVDGGAVFDAAALGADRGTLAPNACRISSRLPGFAVMTAMTWIMVRLRWKG